MKTTKLINKDIFKLSILVGSFIFLMAQLFANSHALPLSWLNNIMTSQIGLLVLFVDILLLIAIIKFKPNISLNDLISNLSNVLHTIGKNKIFLLISFLMVFAQLFIVSANAGTTDTEFKDTVTWLTDRLSGNMGLTVILVDLVVGIFMVVMKKNYMALLGSVVLAVLIKFLPTILKSYISFVL